MLLVEITENRSGRPKTQFCEFSDQRTPPPLSPFLKVFVMGLCMFTSQMLHGQLVRDINELMHILVVTSSTFSERERVLFIYLFNLSTV